MVNRSFKLTFLLKYLCHISNTLVYLFKKLKLDRKNIKILIYFLKIRENIIYRKQVQNTFNKYNKIKFSLHVQKININFQKFRRLQQTNRTHIKGKVVLTKDRFKTRLKQRITTNFRKNIANNQFYTLKSFATSFTLLQFSNSCNTHTCNV